MEIVYWIPKDKTGVERIYLKIPGQKVVTVYIKPIVPSKAYRWNYQIVVLTNAFRQQPELRKRLVNAVAEYAKDQLNRAFAEAGIAKTMDAISWDDLIAARDKIGTVRAKRPQDTHVRAYAAAASMA